MAELLQCTKVVVKKTDGMPSVLSGSTKPVSCLPWFCCLSIYEDAQIFLLYCVFILFFFVLRMHHFFLFCFVYFQVFVWGDEEV